MPQRGEATYESVQRASRANIAYGKFLLNRSANDLRRRQTMPPEEAYLVGSLISSWDTKPRYKRSRGSQTLTKLGKPRWLDWADTGIQQDRISMDHEAGMVTSSKSWICRSTTASMMVSNRRSRRGRTPTFWKPQSKLATQ